MRPSLVPKRIPQCTDHMRSALTQLEHFRGWDLGFSRVFPRESSLHFCDVGASDDPRWSDPFGKSEAEPVDQNRLGRHGFDEATQTDLTCRVAWVLEVANLRFGPRFGAPSGRFNRDSAPFAFDVIWPGGSRGQVPRKVLEILNDEAAGGELFAQG